MKKLPLLLACITLSTTAIAENLAPIGDMEVAGTNKLPEGFRYQNPYWLNGFNAKVTTENEDDNKFLRVDMPLAEHLIAASFELAIPEGATKLRISWKVRATITDISENTDESGRGVCMVASWYAEPEGGSDTERGYKHGIIDQIKTATTGWEDREVTMEVPPGKRFLNIKLGTKGTAAIADFDDLVIEPEV